MAMSTELPPLTVGVTTRNRPFSLLRCLESIQALGDLVTEIIVVDDTSDTPVKEAIEALDPQLLRKLTFISQPDRRGYIVARNEIMRTATTRYVLLLDDDTYLVESEPLRSAVGIMEDHKDIAAVACAQAEADGLPWPAAMQPSPVSYRCYVPSFIGFAHLLRRDVFLTLGGYRESFQFYGEEKDYCLRLLNAGHRVMYMPDARVAHVPDPSGRSAARYLRYVIRNDCLCALYNEPLAMMIVTVPVRIARYVLMRRKGRIDDPGGMQWIVSELAARIPEIWRNRAPVKWASVHQWRNLRRVPPAFGARLTCDERCQL
jgi:GT2 family glycosyltransferase